MLAAEYTDEAAAAVADLPQLAGPGPAAGQPAAAAARHAQAATPGAGLGADRRAVPRPDQRAIMRVWIDPADQSRHYVPEPG